MAYFRCGMGGGSSDNFDFIAPAFSTSETYNIDDLVIKDGSLYKCTEDNVTGTWNASKWKNTTLAECSALNYYLGNKPDFAYSPVYTGNYNNDSHTITVEKNKYYMAVFKDANGAGRCNISKLSINNATIEKSMGDSTNNFCIFWFKANSNSITISGTKTAVATFFVSELSNDHAYCKNFTSITYVPKGYDYQTYTVPCTKYAMIISMGYQGSQSLSIAVDAESYRQNSFKNIKSYATHSGYHNFGYAHLICESNDNFNVILTKANNILVYLS